RRPGPRRLPAPRLARPQGRPPAPHHGAVSPATVPPAPRHQAPGHGPAPRGPVGGTARRRCWGRSTHPSTPFGTDSEDGSPLPCCRDSTSPPPLTHAVLP